MEQLIDVLKEIDDEVDWAEEDDLIEKRILDSIKVITLIMELETVFDISIGAGEITKDNFNSADAMWKMICRLQDR